MIHSLYFITFILIILCACKGIDLIIIDVKAEKNGTNSDRDVSAESEFKKIGQELPNLYCEIPKAICKAGSSPNLKI